jgi:hypothetical protein
MIKDKFNLHYTQERPAGTVRSEVELIDYTGENFDKLSRASWFGKWLERKGINYKNLNEEEVGRYLLDFFNDTLRPNESRREFVKIEIV